jgi:hypothetical protein
MTEARRWLESRHLRLAERGRRTLETLATLPADEREAVLARGDALAAISVALAHAWLVASVEAKSSLSPVQASAWECGLTRILGARAGGRGAAQAYLAFSPQVLARLDDHAREAFVAAACELEAHSQRLAASFVECVGSALISHPQDADADAIVTWSRTAAGVLASSRWRGEYLAGRLIESAPSLLPAFTPAAIRSWGVVVAAVGKSGRTPRCPQAPEALIALDSFAREQALATVAAFAASDTHAAERALETLPRALHQLGRDECSALLDALQTAGPRTGLAEAVGLLAASLHEQQRSAASIVISHASEIARRFPAGLAAFLRTADRALELGAAEGVALWVARGLELAARNEKAGIVHFQLETRTSHKLLLQHSTAVSFDEVQPVMQRYGVMIARRSLHLACGGGLWLRPPLSAPEEYSVRLPERIDLFATSEENQLFYKLAVAHAAARWQFGTYDLRIEELRARGVPYTGEALHGDTIEFLDSFSNPLLAAALFVILEGARIDAALVLEFKGLAADLDRLGRLYATLPLPTAERAADALVEALFLMSVGRISQDALPARLQAVGEIAARTLHRLRRPAASVYDSAESLVLLYHTLTLAAVVARGDEELDQLIEMGGATVIDPLDFAESAPASLSPASQNAKDRATPADTRGPIPDHEMQLTIDHGAQPAPAGLPLTPEQIKKLIEAGVRLEISEGHGQEQASLGLYITDLLGKLPAETIERLRRMVEANDTLAVRAWLAAQRGRDFHFYDEWDYQIGDYRRRWCRLTETDVEGDGGRYVGGVLGRCTELITRVRHEFLLMRPEQFRKVRGMDDGDDFDLNAIVEAHADRRTRRTPSERLYVSRRREERDVATLFLIDMSASTDEPVTKADAGGSTRRVIEVTKDALVVMAAVLHELGDAYAVYGFSGHGRENVECYPIKTFAERWGSTVRARIGGIEPKRSTRMGAALRHSARKLAAVSARARHLLLLSDGFPQDYDYGEDRRSNVYGIRDTTVALQELEAQGVKTFCITVDPSGHDYLREMCAVSRYAVLDDVEALPEEMPRIYRAVTR